MSENQTIDSWILGGYLGAGKTTSLNAMLAAPFFSKSNPALIINEFGTIGVDGALIENRSLSRFEINKGSLFCICTKTDFIKALDAIAGGQHDALLIEATGIAEPVDIESFIAASASCKRFKLRGNICVVDAVNFTKVAAFLKPATSQVRWADIVIINKCDMASRREIDVLRKIISDINHNASVHETSFGQFDTNILSNVRHRTVADELRTAPPANISAASFTADTPVPASEFRKALDLLGENILRLKGNIVFEQGPAYVEIVCGIRTEKPANNELTGASDKTTAFTVICWNMEKDKIQNIMSASGFKPA